MPCNNDLLAANFIDDGRLWLIDYEYSGNNDPFFEIGNVRSEAAGTPTISTGWSRRTSDTPRHRSRHEPVSGGLMSKYGWMLWASIQE